MSPAPVDASALARVRAWAAEYLGLRFDDSGPENLAAVLEHRVAETGSDWRDYVDRLTAHRCPAEELRALARELTVTETYFFRAPGQLRSFAEVALPACQARAAGARPLHVLSAGCSSGDEPYSLAIAARELPPAGAAAQLKIDAFDINTAALQRAQRASYSSWSMRELPAGLRTRWFRREGDAFVLDGSIRRSVAFHERNLASDDAWFWQPDRFDIVFCRNVLMYFTEEQAEAAVRRLARALTPDGYLFLGQAETLRGLSNEFHLCHTHDSFYYRRKADRSRSAPAVQAPAAPAQRQDAGVAADLGWIEAIQRASERIAKLATAPSASATAQQPRGSAPDLSCALELLQRERFAQVLDELGAMPAEHARDADVLLLRAVTLSHSGALAEAEAACRELLAHDELNAGAHYVLALCRDAIGETADAVEHDHRAAHLDSAFAMPRLHLGLIERRRGHREAAQRELAQAMRLLQREESARLLLFGGGFRRDALIALCRAEHAACAAAP